MLLFISRIKWAYLRLMNLRYWLLIFTRYNPSSNPSTLICISLALSILLWATNAPVTLYIAYSEATRLSDFKLSTDDAGLGYSLTDAVVKSSKLTRAAGVHLYTVPFAGN